jgi:NAD(P)-dependent dehydrogenase (short-subunit alcohol dehydrogenase family)
MVDFNFSDKKVLVFGGSRGIGRGVVDKFLYSGADVYYAARSHSVDIKELSAKFFAVDLNNEKEIIDLFDRLDDIGGVDIVVNAAAINFCNVFDEISVDEWDDVLRVNLRASSHTSTLISSKTLQKFIAAAFTTISTPPISSNLSNKSIISFSLFKSTAKNLADNSFISTE